MENIGRPVGRVNHLASFFLASAGTSTFALPTSLISTVRVWPISISRGAASPPPPPPRLKLKPGALPSVLLSYLASIPSFTQNFACTVSLEVSLPPPPPPRPPRPPFAAPSPPAPPAPPRPPRPPPRWPPPKVYIALTPSGVRSPE